MKHCEEVIYDEFYSDEDRIYFDDLLNDYLWEKLGTEEVGFVENVNFSVTISWDQPDDQ